MAGTWKKHWRIRSYPEAVLRILKSAPFIYSDGVSDGVIGWMGRTFSHQRRDFKPKSPKLTLEKPNRLVFQHEGLSPFTYTVEATDGPEDTTEIRMEVRTSANVKDTTPADQFVSLCYALTKALEPQPDK